MEKELIELIIQSNVKTTRREHYMEKIVVGSQGVFRKFWHAIKPLSVTLPQATSKNDNLNRNGK